MDLSGGQRRSVEGAHEGEEQPHEEVEAAEHGGDLGRRAKSPPDNEVIEAGASASAGDEGEPVRPRGKVRRPWGASWSGESRSPGR